MKKIRKAHRIITTFMATVIGGTLAICLPLTLTVKSKPIDLSLNATTNNYNTSNHGILTYNEDENVQEISFNTWDNDILHISLVHGITDSNLQWKWCDTFNGDYADISSINSETGLLIKEFTDSKIDIQASTTGRHAFTFMDFYIEANMPGSVLIPKPIWVHFHNAPEVKVSGGIITKDGTTIEGFDTSVASDPISNYDTVYIPPDITAIDTGTFSNKFTGINGGPCPTIQNIIFADRGITSCDVGANAFSSTQPDAKPNPNLFLTGEIYIGSGTYVCGSDSLNNAYFFSAVHGSLTMNDVTINGNCSIKSKWASSFFSSPNNSIAMNDVTINGNCTCCAENSQNERGDAFFFATNTGSITMRDVTIVGNCDCTVITDYNLGDAFFFSSMGTSIVINNVTINGEHLVKGCTASLYFYSGGSLTINDVNIDKNFNMTGFDHSSFLFFSSDGDLKMNDVTIDGQCQIFSDDADALLFSSYDGSIIMNCVIINGKWGVVANWTHCLFFSSLRGVITMADVTFKSGTVIAILNVYVIQPGTPTKFFFYGITTSKLDRFTYANTTLFKTNGSSSSDDPINYNGAASWWPTWQKVSPPINLT